MAIANLIFAQVFRFIILIATFLSLFACGIPPTVEQCQQIQGNEARDSCFSSVTLHAMGNGATYGGVAGAVVGSAIGGAMRGPTGAMYGVLAGLGAGATAGGLYGYVKSQQEIAADVRAENYQIRAEIDNYLRSDQSLKSQLVDLRSQFSRVTDDRSSQEEIIQHLLALLKVSQAAQSRAQSEAHTLQRQVDDYRNKYEYAQQVVNDRESVIRDLNKTVASMKQTEIDLRLTLNMFRQQAVPDDRREDPQVL